MLDAFNKYAWVKLLINKKAKTAFNGFIERVNISKHKPKWNMSWSRKTTLQ